MRKLVGPLSKSGGRLFLREPAHNNSQHAAWTALRSVRQVHPERIRERARHERKKVRSEVRLELLLFSPGHFLQNNRSHERIAALRLEKPKAAELGAIGRPEEN